MKKIFLLIFFCKTQFFVSAQWIQLNSGTTNNLTDVSFINSDTGFAVGWGYGMNHGIVLKTTNGGLTWDSIPYDTTEYVYGVSFPSAQAGYISGDGFIKKTTDLGNTWTTVKNGSAYGQMQFLNDNEGYVLASYPNRFVKTLDGGQTWTDLPNNLGVWDFDFSSVDTGMAADFSNEYEVSRTFDGGVTWTQSLAGGFFGPIFVCIAHITNQKWCAIKASFNIDADLTFDAGQGWMNLTMDSVPPQPYTLLPYRDATFTSATTGWAVGGTYIINTQDGGYTWAVNDSNPDSLYKVNFPNPHVGYAVGENGLIMKYVEPASCSASFNLVADTAVLHHYWAINISTGIPPLSYYWSWGDGTYDSIAYPSHIYAAAGFYTICLTIHDSTGCTDSACYYYQIQKMSSAEAENTLVYVDVVSSLPTATQNAEALQQLLIFPDPAQNYLFINLGSPANGTTIRVYDLQGRMIVLPTALSNTQAQLNITTLPEGFYSLQITDNNTGKTRMKKFVKQQ